MRAMMLLVTSMALTGANVPLAKALSAHFQPDVLLPLRFAIASMALAFLVRLEQRPSLSALHVNDWFRILVLSLMGSVLFTWAVLAGVQRTSGITAGIILSALPAVVAVIAATMGATLRWGETVMIALAVTGLALVQAPFGSQPGPAASDTALGNALMGFAVLCEATFVIVARSISPKLPPLMLSLLVSLMSLAICLPFATPALLRFDGAVIPLQSWGLLAWYALTASALCTVLWYRGAPHVAPWAAGLATAAVPVSAMAVSVVALGERITDAQLAGAALVVAAISVGMLVQRKEPKPA